MSIFQKKQTLAQRFSRDDAKRDATLQLARKASSLSKPWVCPPKHTIPGTPLPQTFQDVAPNGIANLEGRMMLALWPPDQPWFNLEIPSSVAFNPNVDDDIKQAAEQALFIHEVTAQEALQSASLTDLSGPSQAPARFRTIKRQALSQILITGDTLERLDDNYRIHLYRREQYVTRRDTAGDVLYHIVKEAKDPRAITKQAADAANLTTAKINKAIENNQTFDIYTVCEWDRSYGKDGSWRIAQELNGQQIYEEYQDVSPFFSTPFELVPGEDYGRGFIELHLGRISSLDELEGLKLDLAALLAMNILVKDAASQIRAIDLQKPNGSVIEGGRVRGGRVEDIGVLQAANVTNYEAIAADARMMTKELGASMLLESAVQPTGERVTATQVRRIAGELEGALGGFYAPVADMQQTPLIKRVIWQLHRDGRLPELPGPLKNARIRVLTGVNALAKESEAQRVIDVVGVIGQLGAEAMQHINVGVLIDVLMRYRGIHEPGLVKSDQQMREEMEAQVKRAIAMQAAGQSIQTHGKITEEQAKQQGQANA